MADLSQTPANVARGSLTTPTQNVEYGEAVVQGQPLYRSTDSKWYRCDANDGVAKAVVGGIALTPGAANSGGTIALPSSTPGASLVNLGATLAVGTAYCVSATVGAIAPIGDITSTQFVSIIGIATTTALIDFQPSISNTAKA